MIAKFLIVVHRDGYGLRCHYVEKFAEACKRRGIEATVVHTAAERHLRLDPRRYDFTCSFNRLLPFPGGSFFYDALRMPHWSILLNPFFYDLHCMKSPYSIISCVDHYDCEYVRAHGFQNVFFWPHAVERELAADEASERIYDVTLPAKCYDHEALRKAWITALPATVAKLVDEAVELHASDNRTSVPQAVSIALIENDVSPNDVPLQKVLFYVDKYVRGRDRIELVKAIKHAHVHVFGGLSMMDELPVRGWSHSLVGMKNVTIHDEVAYPEYLEIVKRSRICLNSMPFFKNGSHDRIFTSLACGALPLTSDNLWVRDQFEDGEELLIYAPMEWRRAGDLVDHFVEHEQRRRAIAEAGRKKVMREHTWDQRVDLMLQELPPILDRIRNREQLARIGRT